jgi:mannitol-specific phosphotransferase system IIBC component
MSTKVMTRQNEKNRNKIRTMAQIGMLSAIATVLMLFEIPLPFAPSFYEIDFSEVPILIGSFAMGPLAGAAIELTELCNQRNYDSGSRRNRKLPDRLFTGCAGRIDLP